MTANSLPLVHVWSDGSTYPSNPGRGGWAAVIMWNDQVLGSYGTIANASNNYAEAAAVYHALHILRKPCRVQVFTDSQYVVNGLARVQKSIARNDDDEMLLKSNNELWLSMRDVAKRHIVTASHVPGHSIFEYNELANDLAELGSQQARQGMFYVHELEETSTESRILKTVTKRVESRKAKQAKAADRVAEKKRGTGYSAGW